MKCLAYLRVAAVRQHQHQRHPLNVTAPLRRQCLTTATVAINAFKCRQKNAQTTIRCSEICSRLMKARRAKFVLLCDLCTHLIDQFQKWPKIAGHYLKIRTRTHTDFIAVFMNVRLS